MLLSYSETATRMKETKNTRTPEFFIVGAAKAGTTALYRYLAQHPDIYMSPIKEPNYFSTDIDTGALRETVKERLRLMDIPGFIDGPMTETIHRAFITDPDQYLKLFRYARESQICGEASVSYLYSRVAAEAIYKFNPQAKIIIVLRNPVERMLSHYLMDRRMAVTDASFREALEQDKQAKFRTWGSTSLYIDLGMYFEQVKRYTDKFKPEQILIVLHEELKDNTVSTVNRVFHFLGVRNNFNVDVSQDSNSAVLPRNKFVQRLIANNYMRVRIRQWVKNRSVKQKIKQLLFSKPAIETMDPELEKELYLLFRNDIIKLSHLIGRDLSHWQK